MPNVSELAAMYGKNPPSSLPTKSQARQWPPPAGNKPNPLPKSNFLAQTNATDTVPEWKRQLQQRREALKKQKEQQSDSTNTAQADENKEINTNGQNDANSAKTSDINAKETRSNKLDNSWQKQKDLNPKSNSSSLYKPTTPSWKNNTTHVSNNISNAHSQKSFLSQSSTKFTKSNYERTPNQKEEKNSSNSHESSTSFINKARNSSSTSSASESLKSSSSDAGKFGGNQENDFPSGGSFASRSSQEFSSDQSRLPEEEEAPLPSRDRNSFLHKSISNGRTAPASNNGLERQKCPLPSHVYNQPPPDKPRKPFGARLPSASSTNHISSPPLPQQQPPPLPNDRPPVSPPSPGSNPPGRNNSFLGKQRRESSTSSPAPALPPRNSESDRAPDLPTRPSNPNLSTGSGSGSVAPLLPSRNPPSLPSRGGLPPLPSGQDPPPPLPPPNTRRSSQIPQSPPTPPVEEIPTWDDSEEEGIYDPVAGDFDSSPPPIPYKGPAIPEDTGEGDIYMPMETSDMRQSAIEDPMMSMSKEEEKKKKEMDKKEKEMRKKFKLPLEGEIPIQSLGMIKSDLKSLFGKATVHANEEVEVVRTHDNQKGKWLIRTKKGVYAYVDADNIELSADQLRQVMHSIGNKPQPNVPPTPAAVPYPAPLVEESLYNAADDDDDDEDGDLYQTFS